jgi:outer membrane protein assembly factor BamB
MVAALAVPLAMAACAGAPAPHRATTRPPSPAVSPGSSTPTQHPAPAQPATDWITYHGNGARSGAAQHLPAAGRLAMAWSRDLGGAVYGQPLVVGNTVIAATETDVVYGLDRGTGAVLWHTSVGTPVPLSQQPCGDLDPLGITSTPVYDPQTRLVYVVAQSGRSRHVLAALAVADGRIAFTRDVPSPDHQPAYDQQRGALLAASGSIYVVFGGHFGDCGPYVGSIVAMPATGRGPISSYQIPTSKQAGIWAPGGPVAAPDGTIYVSAGNGAASETRFDGSDSVTALTPRLKRIGIFAPSDWRTLSAGDLDLGSMTPALLPDGRILQVGKSGTGYLLTGARLGGVGGQVASGQVCAAFGAAAVSGTMAYVPCYGSGLAAVDTAGGKVALRWRGPASAWGSPVIGGGAIWVADWQSGVLYELDQATGAVRQQIGMGGELPHFVSPALSGDLVLIGTTTGVTAVTGA